MTRTERRLQLRLLSLVVLQELAEQHVGDGEAEDRVAGTSDSLSKTPPLVLVHARPVRASRPVRGPDGSRRRLEQLQLLANGRAALLSSRCPSMMWRARSASARSGDAQLVMRSGNAERGGG